MKERWVELEPDRQQTLPSSHTLKMYNIGDISDNLNAFNFYAQEYEYIEKKTRVQCRLTLVVRIVTAGISENLIMVQNRNTLNFFPWIMSKFTPWACWEKRISAQPVLSMIDPLLLSALHKTPVSCHYKKHSGTVKVKCAYILYIPIPL